MAELIEKDVNIGPDGDRYRVSVEGFEPVSVTERPAEPDPHVRFRDLSVQGHDRDAPRRKLPGATPA